jgi:acetylornithine deacetylase/succinyl-diaminopimelate desuccinylase-like protein
MNLFGRRCRGCSLHQDGGGGKAGFPARRGLFRRRGGGKANLYASVGPAGGGGVMLSGHTDVVPVEGQAWTRPPFALTERRAGRFMAAARRT